MHELPKSKLRCWRLAEGLSVVAAAARIGVSRQTWHAWERGDNIPPGAMMRRLFDLTGGQVTANDFYHLPPPETGPLKDDGPSVGAGKPHSRLTRSAA